jgi:hypothetical protein
LCQTFERWLSTPLAFSAVTTKYHRGIKVGGARASFQFTAAATTVERTLTYYGDARQLVTSALVCARRLRSA